MRLAIGQLNHRRLRARQVGQNAVAIQRGNGHITHNQAVVPGDKFGQVQSTIQ